MHLQQDPSGIATSVHTDLSDEDILALMAKHASKLLDAGVTTARDLGAKRMNAIVTREKIAKGEIPGPRVQCANAPLTVPGGHCAAMGGVCEGVEGVRAEVRKRASEGANLIKVMSTGGFMTAGSHPSQARFTPEEMSAIKDEALKFGLPVTTHATGTQGIDRAADANFDSIEHCAWINPDGKAVFDPVVAQKLVDKNIAVCPTMNTACISQCYFCPWDSRDAIVDNLRKMRAAGVRLVAGTDAGIGLCRFERYADGLTVLADAGYTPREIVAAATEDAAELCGLGKETGRLEPGLAADLAAFAGNPLEDIANYLQPRFVMALGREHKLTPIEPLGNIKEQADLTFKLLRQGAGLPV
jgi:imidazolonepropionase-like amidohydrolase